MESLVTNIAYTSLDADFGAGAKGWMVQDGGFDSQQRQTVFIHSVHIDYVAYLPSYLVSTAGFSAIQSDRALKLTIHLHLFLTAMVDIYPYFLIHPHNKIKSSQCLTKLYSMKTCMESGCIDPHFLYLFTGWT
jgi:hypothetical protein